MWCRQISNFLTTNARHMKFLGLAKYEENIKFDKIWAYQNGDTLQMGSPKFQLFNHLC